MSAQRSLEQSYLILFRFLMFSKHRVFELGASHGLSGMQTVLLFLLDTPRPMSEFRRLLNCDASNITGIVDGLEQKQLVTRDENSDDRRVKMVELTTQGKRFRSNLLKQFISQGSPLLAHLTAQELKIFVELLEKITKGAQDV